MKRLRPWARPIGGRWLRNEPRGRGVLCILYRPFLIKSNAGWQQLGVADTVEIPFGSPNDLGANGPRWKRQIRFERLLELSNKRATKNTVTHKQLEISVLRKQISALSRPVHGFESHTSRTRCQPDQRSGCESKCRKVITFDLVPPEPGCRYTCEGLLAIRLIHPDLVLACLSFHYRELSVDPLAEQVLPSQPGRVARSTYGNLRLNQLLSLREANVRLRRLIDVKAVRHPHAASIVRIDGDVRVPVYW